MITANAVNEMMKKITEEQEKAKKEIAMRLINELIEPSILAAAKRGEHGTVGTIEHEYLPYVRKEIENNGFTTHAIGQGKLRILW